MKITVLLFSLLIILIIISKNESFEEEKCSKVAEGECNSYLCPEECKIQHSENSKNCYCVERK